MGFKSLIDGQVQGAMRILGQEDGLAPAYTYISVSESSRYDPNTGDVTRVVVEYPEVPMVLARFKIEEMDSSIIPMTDRKALIAALDLDTVPKSQDRIELDNGEQWSIEKVMGVPGDSLHILHIRKQDRSE